MDATKLTELKKKLLEEKARLESELTSVGHINPDNPGDWEPDAGDFATEGRDADPNSRADAFEEAETRSGILNVLETQLVDVNAALEKMENGTYGTCEVSGEEISIARLEANPAARTCTEHMN